MSLQPKVETLHNGLENFGTGSRNVILCKPHSFFEGTKTAQTSATSTYEQGTKTPGRCGSRRNAEEGSHCSLPTESGRGISQQSLSSGKERWRL